ncbi:MAG: ThuA domain-containing protein [Phycisphaerae bacterium]|nr:ThuA domain-containing protein [Phycisphaerae bacterium]
MNKITKIILILAFIFTTNSIANAAVSADELAKIQKAAPAKAPAKPATARKLLIFSKCNGYRHGSIPYVTAAIEIMGKKTGAYTTAVSEDMNVFAPEYLNGYDAVCFNNTTMLTFTPSQRQALMSFVKGGKGIVGIHAATDNFYKWPEAAEMMGGTFDGHPWVSNGTWAVQIEDGSHPLMKSFAGKDFKITEEIYRTKPMNLRENNRVLMGLDFGDKATATANGVRESDVDVPISWLRDYHKGRVFYCGIGHNKQHLWNPAILGHYLAGIQFAFGDLEASTEPISLGQAEIKRFNVILDNVKSYKYGDDDKQLRKLERDVMTETDPAKLVVMVKGLNDFVVSDATLASKQMACRLLSVVGKESSVNPLVSLLADDKTAGMALYALGTIEGLAVDEALRNALPKVKAEVQIGIINVIGQRKDSYAVEALTKAIGQGKEETVLAGINALGHIADHQAAKVLNQFIVDNSDPKIKAAAYDALLRCAESFAANDTDAASKAYRLIYETAGSDYLRAAGLNGLLSCSGEKAGKLVVEVLKSGDQAMAIAVLGQVRKSSSVKQLKSYVALMPELQSAVRAQLLSALAETKDPTVLPAIIAAIADPDQRVRLTAIAVLPNVGGVEEIKLLLDKTINGSREEQAAARESLKRLRGKKVDAAMLAMLDNAEAAVKIELITAISSRGLSGDLVMLPLIKIAATEASSKVRQEALKALPGFVKAKDFTALVQLILILENDRDRSLAINVAEAAYRCGDVDMAIVKKSLAVEDVAKKVSIIELAGKLSAANCLEELAEILKSDNPVLKTAVIKALSQWQSDEPIMSLYEIAKNSQVRKDKVLAFRGFVKLIGQNSNRPGEVSAKYCRDGMAIAETATDKRQVIAAIGQCPAWETFTLAYEYIQSADLANDAAAVTVSIGQKVAGYNPSQVREVIQSIIGNSNIADNIKNEGKEILKKIAANEAFITDWKVSGPYQMAGKDYAALFDIAFAPEKNEAVAWKNLSAANRGQKAINLLKEYNGESCVMYLATSIYVDSEQTAKVNFGSDDGAKVWINKQNVFGINASRAHTHGVDKFDIKLNKGWNTILAKITQGAGDWALSMEIRDLSGKPVKGMRIDPSRIK